MRPLSSVGESVLLLTGRSPVQIRQGPPNNNTQPRAETKRLLDIFIVDRA